MSTNTTQNNSRRRYQRNSTALGQYFEDRSENEGAILRDISSSRREAAKTEKELNDTLLTTAKAEEKAKEDIWKMKKETAEY